MDKIDKAQRPRNSPQCITVMIIFKLNSMVSLRIQNTVGLRVATSYEVMTR